MDLNTDLVVRELEALANVPRLREENAFALRAPALDDLEFKILDPLEAAGGAGNDPEADGSLRALLRRAERLRDELEAVDQALFEKLRAEIRAGLRGQALRERIAAYVPPGSRGEEVGYDLLDAFLDGLFDIDPVEEETSVREPEMVSHQKTPARVVLELVERAGFAPDEVFFDLGSGLGQVPILVRLLSEAKAAGVEIEPAWCAAARRRAVALGVDVAFVDADARAADLSRGTAFFLYTPFKGRMLAEVLGRLREVARRKPVRVFTYGPCTLDVAREPWLRAEGEGAPDARRLQAFRSL